MMEYRIAIPQQMGNLLRNIRKANHLTQQELGERLGLSQRMVAKLEAHPEKVTFERVHQALSALKIDLVLRDRKTGPASPGRIACAKNANGDEW
jgi:HTH-type transcriptional regulator/antitoxin HipB